jgi:hypothetical protein
LRYELDLSFPEDDILQSPGVITRAAEEQNTEIRDVKVFGAYVMS